jgi:hypothetical protein
MISCLVLILIWIIKIVAKCFNYEVPNLCFKGLVVVWLLLF